MKPVQDEKTIRVWLNRCVQVWKSKVRPGLKAAYGLSYRFCYLIGMYTIRAGKSAGRKIASVLRPCGRVLYKAADWLLLRHLRALAGECKRFGQGFPLAVHKLREAFRRHPLLVIPQLLFLPFQAVRRHRKAVVSLVNLAMPAAACVVLFFTLQYWGNLTFALSLEYGGQQLGYIRDESVFDDAVNMAAERVINTDDSFSVERTPRLTLAVVSSSELLDKNTVCDKILLTSGDAIAQASGLYVDNKFQGAVADRAELDGVLDGILDQYRTDADNERAEFVQKVEVVDGLYPTSAVVDARQMQDFLTSETVVEKLYTAVPNDSVSLIADKFNMSMDELRAMNPQMENDFILVGDELVVQRPQQFLRVKVIRTIEYDEDINFATLKETDSSQYVGYERVKVEGVTGKRHIKAEIILMDGMEQSREILENTVIQEAVNKVIVVGSKAYGSNNTVTEGDGITNGQYVWPIPAGQVISQYYHSGHRALDLSGGVLNKPVIAADGGVVVEANATDWWGQGWGYYVLIRHQNGDMTRYAHLNRVDVVVGQKVSQAQLIGLAGSSGRSTGPHLHFELIRGGVQINPLPYLKR